MLKIAGALLVGMLVVVSGGCRYSYSGALPEHIQTVRVKMFRTDPEVFYYGLESKLTRALIEKLAKDPRVQVVNDNEDATITGMITRVDKSIQREDKTDRPTRIRLSIRVKFSVEDNVQGTFLVKEETLSSSSSSSGAGVYDLERGEGRSLAETKALDELAAEITRRTVAMW